MVTTSETKAVGSTALTLRPDESPVKGLCFPSLFPLTVPESGL
jgi:hypothetical protein